MAETNYAASLPLILKWEGGYVNHPKDPGGPTNKGVTQRTYDAYRRSRGLPTQSVLSMSPTELGNIYRIRYWDAVRGDDLPVGLDYAMFDFGVNSGPYRAIQFIQRIVGVDDDGVLGPITISKINAGNVTGMIESLCAARLQFLRSLPTWSTFGRGWTNRVNDVKAHALAMARQVPPSPGYIPEPEEAPADSTPKPNPWRGIFPC